MIEATNSFSPSVNIERDLNKDFRYIVTKNSQQIYQSLIKNVDSGTHAFTIIGSYGTGKSSFLIALRKNLINEIPIFQPVNGEFVNINGFEFDYLVGKYESITEQLKTHFGLKKEDSVDLILQEIDKKHNQLKKEGKFWLFVIDEFGKNLEYSAKENPDEDLYFIQQFAEYVNEKEKNVFFITTLHQAFDSYAYGLDIQQRKEWDKVRGRFKELTFNEPVEQLLFIVSEYLKESDAIKPSDKFFDEYLSLIKKSHAFPLQNELNTLLFKNIFPIEPLAAATLTLALQKYGQNERSLFTFLQSDDLYGLNNYDSKKHSFYDLVCVYDYLIYNHHSFISSKYNQDFIQWNALKKSLERIEVAFDEGVDQLKAIVKTVGLLNIFANSGAKIDKSFIENFCEHIYQIQNAADLLDSLEKKQIIRYKEFKHQYVLFEGTDFDIDFELNQVSYKIQLPSDISITLSKYFSFPYIPAKRAYFEKGTPRYFEFILSEKPHTKRPKHPIDGYINLLFNNDIEKVKSLQNHGKIPILYAVFKKMDDIRNQLFLIERSKYVISSIDGDQVAYRELHELLDNQIEELNNMILGNLSSPGNDIVWIYNGEVLDIRDSKSLNFRLSEICNDVYSKTPKFDNELINREKVSASVYKPRKNLLERLIYNYHLPDLGFDKDAFPAEKTIYLSLLKNSEIHRERNGVWTLGEPHKKSGLIDLWNESERFFDSTKTGKKPIKDLFGILRQAPYGLKSGFIDLWVPVYLIIKGDDYALYQEESYIPELTFDIINLVYRNPKLFEIKAYQISDVKRNIFSAYRSINNDVDSVEFTNKSFIETIRPFLLLYNNLNEYGRTTSKISTEAQRLRDAIKTATEPEKAFFEDFVTALGYRLVDLQNKNTMSNFINALNNAIDEIKNSYSVLIDNIEKCLCEAIGIDTATDFSTTQEILYSRYQSIPDYEISPYQRSLLHTIKNKLDDREKWLSSIAFTMINKSLFKIKDNEVPLLMKRIHERFEELDNLVVIEKSNFDSEKQSAFMMKIQPYKKEPKNINVVVNRKSIEEQSSKIDQIKSLLSGAKKIKQAILIKIIEDLENNE